MNIEFYLVKNKKKYLIFDLDSTLVKLNIDWSNYRKGVWETVAVFDEPLTHEVSFEQWKYIELVHKAITKHGDPAKKALDLFNEKYEETHYSGYAPNSALLDFIRRNKEYTYFIWTSNSRKTIQSFLVEECLMSLFTNIVTREMVQLIKPAIDGFNLIHKVGTDKKDYLLVGDNFTDEQAAKSIGIDFLKIDYFKVGK